MYNIIKVSQFVPKGATFASIARALALDYYNVYVVDLETDAYIEYSSTVGGDELSVERKGEDFFNACIEASYRIYEEDRAHFFEVFSKEKIIRELYEHGVFNVTYRLLDFGDPVYVNMKITPMNPKRDHIIIGISIVDAQMKQTEAYDKIQKEHSLMEMMLALSEHCICLYLIDPETHEYTEYASFNDYESLGFEKEGEDFFIQGIADGKLTVHPDDLPGFLEKFTKENVMNAIKKKGFFSIDYRLVINGEPRPINLRIASFTVNGKVKLIAGVRERRGNS